MDWRLNLLLHCPLGLTLSPTELETLVTSPVALLEPQEAQNIVLNPRGRAYLMRNSDWQEVSKKILKISYEQGIHWTYPYQWDYPRAWLELSVRPAVVSYRGEVVWNQERALLSVVGSRTPRPDTVLWMQRELPALLMSRNIALVSGGARGVDQWAHRLCMDSGRPTICVFPSGLMSPYPLGCETLWRRILNLGGALMSTFRLQQPIHKGLFAVRNRWIAGLSRATFVVEGNRRSGTLLTGQLAVEEHRTVCTLPVFPMSSQGLGNLDLLAQGALMIRDHADLTILCDRELRPALTNRAYSENCEQGIDSPKCSESG